MGRMQSEHLGVLPKIIYLHPALQWFRKLVSSHSSPVHHPSPRLCFYHFFPWMISALTLAQEHIVCIFLLTSPTLSMVGRRVRWGAGRGQSTESGVHLLLLILPDGWKFLPRVNIHVIVVWVHCLHKREFLFSASWHLSTEADFWLVLQDNKRWCFIALIRTEFYFSFAFVVDTFLHKGKWNIILDTCTLIQHLLPFAAFALSFKKIA